jgi:hypothetical protein
MARSTYFDQAESQTRVQAQSQVMPNVFNVGILSNA